MAGTLIFFSVFLLFGVVFCFIGLYMVRNSERAAGFFNGMGGRLYGKRVADRVYTPRNLLWGAWAFVIIGPLFAAQAIYEIIHAIVTGTAG